MTIRIEYIKLRKSGYFCVILAGGLLASAFPVVNMILRTETFINMESEPYRILMEANWQMMAMFNVLISVCGACLMYYIEYSENGLQKMEMLPVSRMKLFLGKFVIAVLGMGFLMGMEHLCLMGCMSYWFPDCGFRLTEFLQGVVFQWYAEIPTVMLMLVIASMCRNMWMSLGIGVILVFTVSVLPQEHPVFSLFPFSSPFQIYASVAENERLALFFIVCAAETLFFGVGEYLLQKFRRFMQ